MTKRNRIDPANNGGAFHGLATNLTGEVDYDRAAHLRDDTPPVPDAAVDLLHREFEKGTVKHIELMRIVPDSAQPRRALPSALRALWDGAPESLPTLFDVWVKRASEESGAALNLYTMALSAPDTDEDADETAGDDAARPCYTALVKLTLLASTIHKDGLQNAITLHRYNADNGGWYVIETGERRWLAFHLLHKLTGDAKWLKIPARIDSQFSRWRQANENNARASLNAVARARQLALLLMELHTEQGVSFAEYADVIAQGLSDRMYYAQVADTKQYRVPYGQGDRLAKAMGLPNAVQVRQYRDILRLPDSVWVQADDENWSENRIREWLEQARQQDGTDDQFVTTVTNSDTKPSSKPSILPDDPALKTGRFVLSQDQKRVLKALTMIRSGVAEAQDTTKSAVDAMLDEAERTIQQLRQQNRG